MLVIHDRIRGTRRRKSWYLSQDVQPLWFCFKFCFTPTAPNPKNTVQLKKESEHFAVFQMQIPSHGQLSIRPHHQGKKFKTRLGEKRRGSASCHQHTCAKLVLETEDANGRLSAASVGETTKHRDNHYWWLEKVLASLEGASSSMSITILVNYYKSLTQC